MYQRDFNEEFEKGQEINRFIFKLRRVLLARKQDGILPVLEDLFTDVAILEDDGALHRRLDKHYEFYR
jgi:hypothetical protein